MEDLIFLGTERVEDINDKMKMVLELYENEQDKYVYIVAVEVETSSMYRTSIELERFDDEVFAQAYFTKYFDILYRTQKLLGE